MNTRGQRINPMVAGAIAGVVMIFIVLVMAYINVKFSPPPPFASNHTLSVETTDADGISVSSDVRIQGRLVGQVTDVTSRGQTATVSIIVDGSEWPLPAKTQASVRLATLLGQKYIELEPPSTAATGPSLNDGDTIKGAKPVVDFDQILSTFDAKTRESLKDILATGGRAVANQEGTIQNLLPDLALLNQQSQTPTGELAARDQDINSILKNLAVTANQLAVSRDDLVGVIDNANRLTGALAANTDALRSFIRDGDTTTQLTDAVLGNGYATKLSNDLIHLNPVVHDLKALLADLYPQTLSFSKCCIAATHALIYEIGDATSQSDKDGHFLRQNLQTLDFSNILPGQSPTGSSNGTPPPPSHGGPSAATTTPATPTVPVPTVPVPPVKPVCVLGVCLGSGSASGSGAGSGSGGSGGAKPTPTPSPACVVTVIGTCAVNTAYTPAAAAATDSTGVSSSFDYATAVFTMWEAG